MDKLARIEARHTLQGVMEYVCVLRDAVEPKLVSTSSRTRRTTSI